MVALVVPCHFPDQAKLESGRPRFSQLFKVPPRLMGNQGSSMSNGEVRGLYHVPWYKHIWSNLRHSAFMYVGLPRIVCRGNLLRSPPNISEISSGSSELPSTQMIDLRYLLWPLAQRLQLVVNTTFKQARAFFTFRESCPRGKNQVGPGLLWGLLPLFTFKGRLWAVSVQ